MISLIDGALIRKTQRSFSFCLQSANVMSEIQKEVSVKSLPSIRRAPAEAPEQFVKETLERRRERPAELERERGALPCVRMFVKVVSLMLVWVSLVERVNKEVSLSVYEGSGVFEVMVI